MRPDNFVAPTLVAGWLFLTGCSDPASQVHQSGAEPAQTAPESPAPSSAGREYVIRADSTISFVGSKVTGSHNGGFKKFSGTFQVADGKIAGAPVIRIAMDSTWSDNERLTTHLKSADFFDVQKYPLTTFTATSIKPSNTLHRVTGNLHLHGVTRSITFPATILIGDEVLTVKAAFAINRKQFNINYPGKPNDLIRDNVVIRLDLKATPGPAGPEDQLAMR